MLNKRPFLYLDIVHIHLLTTYISLTIYLLVVSILFKINYCGGIHVTCIARKDSTKHSDVQLIGSEIFDWIAFDQYLLVINIFFTILFGAWSSCRRNRKNIFVSILLLIANLSQFILIQVSDDRDYPSSEIREGYSRVAHVVVFTNNHPGLTICKCIYLGLISLEFIILIYYFIKLRFELLYHHEELIKTKLLVSQARRQKRLSRLRASDHQNGKVAQEQQQVVVGAPTAEAAAGEATKKA